MVLVMGVLRHFPAQDLDECQSYIILRRWCKSRGVELNGQGLSIEQQQELQSIYFAERRCLLVCFHYILQTQGGEKRPLSLQVF